MAVFPGADERTPSKAQYFSWINNTNEGATEAQTRANLAFFAWLRDEYGMELDIYAFDAGNIDGAKMYGSMRSERFQRQFPRGFGPLARQAAEIGCRLGIWLGPDGFGDSREEGEARRDELAALCRDHAFALFKMDAVCGQLRPEKQGLFVETLEACRRYSPDLILLNHRLDLGIGMPHATTTLFEGAETYIDVHMANTSAARHNRAGALARGLPPGLTRLTEDHGVCLSSCLDYWQDDLVLQAFNRCLILAPELYGNPWLLRDDEYPQLARIFRLHRRYRDILVDGQALPEARFGPNAVARGDGQTRLITLRNLTWEPATFEVPLDATIGLEPGGPVHVRRFHPFERLLGDHPYGRALPVEVPPFRSLLLLATTAGCDEPAVEGCDFEVVRNMPDAPLLLRLLGEPGTSADVRLPDGGVERVTFPGVALRAPAYRKLGDLVSAPVPGDARALYEATCFAADNDALEWREARRSGPTESEPVRVAREAFYAQPLFRQRHGVSRWLFDDDPDTAFATSRRWGDLRVAGGAFRLDLGAAIEASQIVIEVDSEYDLQPLKSQEQVPVWISADLAEWCLVYAYTNPSIEIRIPEGERVRYVVAEGSPDRVRSVRGSHRGQPLDRSAWRASNLFAPFSLVSPASAWTLDFYLDELHPGSHLTIAVHGEHGVEGVTAALRGPSGVYGAAHRAPSFPSNTWECPVVRVSGNTSWFIPLDKHHVGVPLQAVVMGLDYRRWPWMPTQSVPRDLRIEAYLDPGPGPLASVPVRLDRFPIG